MSEELYDAVIIGAGAAGMSAGIYAARAGLKAIILEGAIIGGQANLSPHIPNYPGFPSISGMDLVERFKGHAQEYVEIREGEMVESIEKGEQFTLKTQKNEYRTKTVILATGAKHRHLGVPGEGRLGGKGVSYCATCDGFFFKGKRVIMVGGGNTASIEALYLRSVGVDVLLVHRRDELRAEKSLQKRLLESGTEFAWSSALTSIEGEEHVTGVKLKNLKDGSVRDVAVEGVFIAIGVVPNNKLAEMLGVELEDVGYVITDRKMRTKVRGIYAAGDITGGLKQVVTAVAEGAQAAISAFEDVSNPYWKDEGVNWE